jgi:hypothetical protein
VRYAPIPDRVIVNDWRVRTLVAVILTIAAVIAIALFVLVLVTKVTVLDDDAVARRGLVIWFAAAGGFGVAARYAWRRATAR